MNFGPKSKKLYHHLILQDLTSEEELMNDTLVIGLLMVATFRQSVGNVLCPQVLPEHQEDHG